MQLRDRKVSARLKKAWAGVAARLGYRRSGKLAGLVKLRKDVRSCEYGDVHVLWEMLRKNDQLERSPKKSNNEGEGECCNCFGWAKHARFVS